MPPANSVAQLAMDLLGAADVAYAAGVPMERWRRHHVLAYVQGANNIHGANTGRMPFVTVGGTVEDYLHETAAPRGGTRRTQMQLIFHTRCFPVTVERSRAHLHAMIDAAMAVLRNDSTFVIGDETREAPVSRPYGLSQVVSFVVETSYNSDYDC